MCTETRDGHRTLPPYPSSLESGSLADPAALCSGWTSILGESPVSASQDLTSLLQVLFMGVGDSNSGLHGCVPSVLPTQRISPAPNSDVFKNKDCSLGYLCSQPIQNLWGGLKICRPGWGPSISQPSILPATTSTFFAYLLRLSSESGLWLQGRTTQSYALSSKNLWVSI